MKHFLLLFFVLITSYSFGQNYQIFNDNQVGYYKYQIPNSALFYYPADSIIYFSASGDSSIMQGNDKIIYHSNVVREIYYTPSNCLLIRDSSLFGNQTIQKNNGDYLFLTQNSDTLLLKTQATIGTIWELGRLENGTLSVKAKVINVQPKSIFNVIDNVKTISLTVKNTSGTTVNHPINSLQIELSENYGILKTPNFLYFDSDTREIELVGHSALNGSFKEVKWADIYNFDVGDVFHTLYRRTPAPTYETNIYTSKTITSKQITSDSVSYETSIERVIIDNVDGVIDTTSSTYNDIESYPLTHPSDWVRPQTSYRFGDSTNILPIGSYSLDHYRYGFHNMDNEYINGRIVKSEVNNYTIYNREDSCNNSFICPYDEKEYIEGAGGPYNAGWGFDPSSYRLVYYKKGAETWGTPYDFDLLSDTKSVIPTVEKLQITPNPATNNIIISSDAIIKNGQLTVFDMAGKVIHQVVLAGKNEVNLSIQNWINGVYLVKIVDKNRVWSGKLVKN